MGILRFTIIVLRNILCLIMLAIFMLTIVVPFGNLTAIFSRKKANSWLLFTGKGMRLIFRICIGVKLEIRGREYITDKPCIIASKHQSVYETLTMFNDFFPKAAYVVKAEFGIPFFYLHFMYKQYEGIKIRREDGVKALIKLEQQALAILKKGRQVVIFPEGTRTTFGETVEFKRGVERIYAKSNVPVIPVALNTGAVWPRGFLGYPGKIIIEFLPPISPGQNPQNVFEDLAKTIADKSNELAQETPCNYYLEHKLKLDRCVKK